MVGSISILIIIIEIYYLFALRRPPKGSMAQYHVDFISLIIYLFLSFLLLAGCCWTCCTRQIARSLIFFSALCVYVFVAGQMPIPTEPVWLVVQFLFLVLIGIVGIQYYEKEQVKAELNDLKKGIMTLHKTKSN